jgi:hypothetical protein
MQWYPNGSFGDNVSYQLVGAGSQGLTKGALVHFSETNVTRQTPATITPWIALVACDANATDASQEEDIFTLARDKGAVSALLFSVYSQGCIINAEYADPASFDQVLDIFSTLSITSARLIEGQFQRLGPSNITLYGSYDSQQLNDSAAIVNTTITSNNPVTSGYLFATLTAYNATVVDKNTNSNGSVDSNSPNGSASNTGLAMIILYAITGCVSALFIIVIISGAIRAIRHPERYGPRAGVANGGSNNFGQSRARGLTRAILDTFPVVKFGTSRGGDSNVDKDVESRDTGPRLSGMEMGAWDVVDASQIDGQGGNGDRPIVDGIPAHLATEADLQEDMSNLASGSGQHTDDSPLRAAQSPREGDDSAISTEKDVVPDAIGRETCPICIIDFAEGDDLRLLPCEGKHAFHKECVDPWLLELSSSCPICRQDFQALETILSGESDDGHGWPMHGGIRGSGSHQGNRFSRYLRFARRRNHEREDDGDTIDS